MSTPVDPYSAASQNTYPGAAASQVPGTSLGATQLTVNTSVLNVSTDAAGGLFGYSGSPTAGNLFFSVSPAGGSDPYGNNYNAGLSVTQGQLSGVSLTGISVDSTSVISGATMNNGQVVQPSIQAGTASSTTVLLNNSGGQVLSYTVSSASVTTFSTHGTYQWTCPTGVTQVQVQCWGAGAGGGGGQTYEGGEAGGGGEFAEEPTLTVVPGTVYQVIVGQGGSGGATGSSGTNGGSTSFGQNLVFANGGSAGANFTGGLGGQGSTNTIHWNGGAGASGSGGGGGAGGGGSGGTTSAGNAGAQGSGGTGGNGGSAVTGGGAGGGGGNSSVSGSAGSTPGGAGGGAGEGGAASFTNTYYTQYSYSYYGVQVGEQLRTYNGSLYQGCSSGQLNVTGDQYAFALFDYKTIQSNLSGASINYIHVTLTNLGTYYSSGCYVILGYAPFTTFSTGGNLSGASENVTNFWIDENTTLTQDITGKGFGNAFQNGSATCLLLGPSASTSGGPTDLYNYGFFWGQSSAHPANSPTLTINYSVAATDSGGGGSDGQVKISYNVPANQSLVGVVSPTSGTDPITGTPYAPGVTSTQHTLLNQSGPPSTPASGNIVVYADPGNMRVIKDSGWNAYVNTSLADLTTTTVTQTVATQLSNAWTIPTNDPQVGTKYRISASGYGTWGSTQQNLNIACGINGSSIRNEGIPGTVFTTSQPFEWNSIFTLMVSTTGSSGKCWLSQIFTISAVGGTHGLGGLTAQVTVLIGSHSGTFESLNTTTGNNFEILANWASVTGAPTITYVESTYERLGP